MQNIQQFIDVGYHTVPLLGANITRSESGTSKKIGYPNSWQKYKEDFNEVASTIGAVIPGKQSNLIVIDCDSTETTELFEALLPAYKAVAYGVGKMTIVKDGEVSEPIRSSNWFFKYSPNIPVIHNGYKHLEVFSGDGDTQNILLPTQGNKTKTPWINIPETTHIPQALITLIAVWAKASKTTPAPSQSHNQYSPQHSFNLAPMCEKQLVRPDTLDHKLFAIITPKSFRNSLYRSKGYLHPNDIEVGQGNDYISRLSAILASDKSINPHLYEAMMNFVNDQWEYPLSSTKLQKYISHMLTGANKEGKNFWVYDEHWEKDRFMYYSKLEDPMEYFMDPDELSIIEVNHDTYITRVIKDSKIKPILSLIPECGIKPSTKNAVDIFRSQVPAMRNVVYPHLPFGQLSNNRYEFNRFKPTKALEIIRDPQTYKEQYTPPKVFINWLHGFQPDEQDRKYLLSHILTKFLTFSYSPVIYYFVGIPGSGKGTLNKIIAKIIGEENMATNLGKGEATGIFNGWMKDKYFVVFEEMNDKLNRTEAKMFSGNLKTWSGDATFSCREMTKDFYSAPMTATFILNQNGDTFELDPNDRRILYMNSPTKASVDDIVAILATPIEDIAYYIATEYSQLNDEDYQTPPMNAAKRKSINDKLPLGNKILNLLENKDWEHFYNLVADSNIDIELFRHNRAKGYIYVEALGQMYCSLAGRAYDKAEMITKFRMMTQDNVKFKFMHSNNEALLHFIPYADAVEPI